MKNLDADLAKFDDGDLLVARAEAPRDDEESIEISEDDLLDEEDLADDGDLDYEPDVRDF